MKTLLYKQVRLLAHPMTFLSLLFCAMLLIPNYPYTVVFFYITLGLFFMYANAREQNDAFFTALLPIRKRDYVKGAVLFTVTMELASILVAGLFVLLRNQIAPEQNNAAGLDANVALLGLGLCVFAVFNAIFLPAFYRTGYKLGSAFFKASVCSFLLVGVDVVLPHVLPFCDGHDPRQWLVLCTGAVLYALLTALSYRRAAALYERVDL